MTRVYTVKSNARRDAKKLGLNPDLVKEVKGGWAIDYSDVPESKAAKPKAAKVTAPPKVKAPKAKAERKAKPPKAAKTLRTPKAAKQPHKPREGEPKRERLVSMLADWTPISDLMSAMGWQAHTVRGALSTAAKNLKIMIDRQRIDGVTSYRVAPAVAGIGE